MNIPTPRTDAITTRDHSWHTIAYIERLTEHACQLERELTASFAREAKLHDAVLDSLAREQQLREAVKATGHGAISCLCSSECKICAALALPAPPVVSKAEYDKIVESRNLLHDTLNQANREFLQLLAKLKAANDDAERLADKIKSYKNWAGCPDEGPVTWDNFQRADKELDEALAAHEARKKEP